MIKTKYPSNEVKRLPVKSCGESYIFTHTIYQGPSGERTLSMRPIVGMTMVDRFYIQTIFNMEMKNYPVRQFPTT
jgi:hypothetical protein